MLLALLLSSAGIGHAVEITVIDASGNVTAAPTANLVAREAFIDAIINTAQTLFDKANGKMQSAHYASDIYVCKNFTVYLFTKNADRFRMAEYPDVALTIPDNLPSAECVDFAYGQVWKDIPASQGNPFYAAAEFRYDSSLTKAENEAIAMEFMMQVQRGDYFQMSADYYYGIGAHSLVFIENYDPELQTVHWTDSNMKGEKRDGIRYGLVQFDAIKEIDWFVDDAFCHPKRGATLYRLRDDIIFADGQE